MPPHVSTSVPTCGAGYTPRARGGDVYHEWLMPLRLQNLSYPTGVGDCLGSKAACAVSVLKDLFESVGFENV